MVPVTKVYSSTQCYACGFFVENDPSGEKCNQHFEDTHLSADEKSEEKGGEETGGEEGKEEVKKYEGKNRFMFVSERFESLPPSIRATIDRSKYNAWKEGTIDPYWYFKDILEKDWRWKDLVDKHFEDLIWCSAESE